MVDIKWAQDNCTVNKAKIREVSEGVIALEAKIDKEIEKACDEGKRKIGVCVRYHKIDSVKVPHEAIEQVCYKYSSAGYKVEIPEDTRWSDTFIIIEW